MIKAGSRWRVAIGAPRSNPARPGSVGGNEVDETQDPESTAASAVPEPGRDLIGN
jgi:hypothetical protein